MKVMRLSTRILATVLLPVIMVGCGSRPGDVISRGDMVDLMVDIHKGEAYADANHFQYRTDSTKMLIRQSILRDHGVTAEQFDSSLMWYGRNTEDLTEIYAEVIERLEKEMSRIDANASSTSFAGDSINAWIESPFYILSDASPSQTLKFRLPVDENWYPGDSYTWQFKTFNQRTDAIMAMFIDYDDGSTEMISSEFNNDGWQRLTIVGDSLRNPLNIYGYSTFAPRPSESIYLDSVSLVRKRLSEELYRRRYRQRTFNYGNTQTTRNELRQTTRPNIDL